MTELTDVFERLELSQYLDNFIEEGFDTWETVLYITESDLDALNVKLGHRRRLQLEIAHARGISFEQLLSQSTRVSAGLTGSSSESNRPEAGSSDSRIASTGSSMKRKYRRHPKPDEHAPERPPSAYVIFSNQVREELKPQKLSFTDIAKTVGERWQSLPPEEKEPFETKATLAKEQYNQAMAEYKKTENYRDYMKYLADFKAKNPSGTSEGKRTRLEKEPSRGSSTSAGSPMDTSEPLPAANRIFTSQSVQSTSPAPMAGTPTAGTYQSSAASPTMTASRPQLPRIVPLEPRETQPIPSSTRRTVGTPTASFLRHDTSRSSVSSNISGGSTGSSSVFTPITPMDENRHRTISRPPQSSGSSSIDRSFALPPLAHNPVQDNISAQPQSPPYPSSAPMKRLSLADEDHGERPTQRPRSNPPESTISSAGLPPPQASHPQQSKSPPRQRPQERGQDRLDPLSVLALAGNMMDYRGSEHERPF